ncbi:hypothetical protein C0J52_12319 [Blattella germanica]|nr:hypothetical protein C0J52_12319 [Blattella germanica]
MFQDSNCLMMEVRVVFPIVQCVIMASAFDPVSVGVILDTRKAMGNVHRSADTNASTDSVPLLTYVSVTTDIQNNCRIFVHTTVNLNVTMETAWVITNANAMRGFLRGKRRVPLTCAIPLNPITIQEALDIINEEENKPQQDRSEIYAIYIAPPEPDILTDEEQAGLIDNLNGRQLRANAEIKLKSNMEVSYSNDDISEDNISPNKFSVHSSVVPDDLPHSNSGGQNTLNVDVNVLEALKFSSNKRKENKTQWIKASRGYWSPHYQAWLLLTLYNVKIISLISGTYSMETRLVELVVYLNDEMVLTVLPSVSLVH